MKSTIVADLLAIDLEITDGQEALNSYSFGTDVAKHWFCSICGIHVFQNLRSDPGKMSVNAACLSEFDVWSLDTIPVHDGRDNHPSDTGRRRQYSAVQKFIPTERQ